MLVRVCVRHDCVCVDRLERRATIRRVGLPHVWRGRCPLCGSDGRIPRVMPRVRSVRLYREGGQGERASFYARGDAVARGPAGLRGARGPDAETWHLRLVALWVCVSGAMRNDGVVYRRPCLAITASGKARTVAARSAVTETGGVATSGAATSGAATGGVATGSATTGGNRTGGVLAAHLARVRSRARTHVLAIAATAATTAATIGRTARARAAMAAAATTARTARARVAAMAATATAATTARARAAMTAAAATTARPHATMAAAAAATIARGHVATGRPRTPFRAPFESTRSGCRRMASRGRRTRGCPPCALRRRTERERERESPLAARSPLQWQAPQQPPPLQPSLARQPPSLPGSLLPPRGSPLVCVCVWIDLPRSAPKHG